MCRSSLSLLFVSPYLENVTFESPIELEGTLSGIQIPDDLILTESNALQSFLEPLSLAANVTIHGTLTIAESLNNRDVKRMCGLLHPNEQSDYRLHVEDRIETLLDFQNKSVQSIINCVCVRVICKHHIRECELLERAYCDAFEWNQL